MPVYEVGEIEGQPYFSMKFVAGTTLARRLAEGPLMPREAAAIMLAGRPGDPVSPIAKDCSTATSSRRTSCIDEDGQPHVTDFGLAKRITDNTA